MVAFGRCGVWGDVLLLWAGDLEYDEGCGLSVENEGSKWDGVFVFTFVSTLCCRDVFSTGE